jgi:hypothetical protein
VISMGRRARERWGVAALCHDVAQTNDTSDGLCETTVTLVNLDRCVVALPGFEPGT